MSKMSKIAWVASGILLRVFVKWYYELKQLRDVRGHGRAEIHTIGSSKYKNLKLERRKKEKDGRGSSRG